MKRLGLIKKTISSILMLVILTGIIPVSALADNEIIKIDTKVYFNGEQIYTDVYNMNNRILVPLRAITEKMGSSVKWDEKTQMITVQRKLQSAVFKINDNNVYSRERQILDTQSVLYNGTTLIPLRAISEIFDSEVSWNGDSNTVNINCNIPTYEDTLDDFIWYGFRKFNYYGSTFMDIHADGSWLNTAVWGEALSNLGEWSGRSLKGMVNFLRGKGFDTEYEKDMYKKVISQVLSELNGDYTADKFPEAFKSAIKGTKGVYSFSVDEAFKALEKSGKQKGLSSTAIKNRKEDLDVFSKALSKVGKTIKWSQFTIDEIAFIMTDYTENVHMLTVLEDTLSDDKNNQNLKAAVSELKMEYATKYVKTIVDLKDELIEYGTGKIIGSASSLYSIVSFCIETGASVTGWKDYSNNVMDASTLTTVVSALEWELDEMTDKIFDKKNKKIKSGVTEEQWADFIELFKLTQAAVKEQYVCMANVTTQQMEIAYLQAQMEIIDSITVSEDISKSYYDVIKIGDVDNSSDIKGIPYKSAHYLGKADGSNGYGMACSFIGNIFETQPYILYNGEGADLKVCYNEAYTCPDNDKGLKVVRFIGKPKIRIVYGKEEKVFESKYIIKSEQEIDFSEFGIPEGDEIEWMLVFKETQEFKSIEEYKKTTNSSDIVIDDYYSCVAYNYKTNDNYVEQ